MRHLVAIAALAASGCSLFFNPNNVPLKTCDPLPPVAPLDGIVGDGTSITWQWPNAPADAGRFRDWQLCWGPQPGSTDTCKTFPYGSCDGGWCAFKLDGVDAGLKYNTRVSAQVLARDLCGASTAPATGSVTPINGSFLDLEGITLSSPCDAGIHADGTGVLVFDEVAGLDLCVSTAAMGDEKWFDATIDLELRVTGTTTGGAMFRALSGAKSPRNAAIVTATPGLQASVYVTQRPSNGDDAPAASSGAVVPQNGWRSMRVSVVGDRVSVSIGTTTADLREVIRWRDPAPTNTPGQLGLALASLFYAPARLEARNLRVRSGGQIPEGGASRDGWNFNGPNAAHAVRLVGNAGLVPCPQAFTAGCPTCAPDAGSQCLEIPLMGGQATIDTPIGIDYSQPWQVRFKFAADTMGTMQNPSLLRTTQPPTVIQFGENIFSGMPLIDVDGAGWVSAPRMFRDPSQTFGAPITPGIWATFEVTFDQSGYTVKRDGVQARQGPYPVALARHLGAIVLGGGGTYRGYFTDLEIVQPPSP